MNNPVEKAKLIIAKNLREAFSLDTLAEEVGLSKFHFQRIFKKETGLTPKEYVNSARLDHVAHMIVIYPEVKLIDIAFETGFSSPSVFSRSFKHKYKVSPLVFKKNLHKDKNALLSGKITKLPMCFLEKKILRVSPSNLVIENLNFGFRKTISKDNYKGKLYGIFIDAPMHKKVEESRYYIGIEGVLDNQQMTYQLDSGYYTYIDVQGDFQKVIEMIVDFNSNMIEPSSYKIDSLVAFEIINYTSNSEQFDYLFHNRRIYIKIKHK